MLNQFMGITSNTLRLMWRRKLAVVVIGSIIVSGNYVAAVFFNGIVAIYQREAITTNVWDVTIFSFAPAGSLVIMGLALIIEAQKLGWENSSIKRILNADTVSCKTDLYYAVIFASNITAMLGFLFTLGISYHINNIIKDKLDLNLLSESNTVVVFFVLFWSNSLMFYVFHKMAHTRFLWELHKTHHSATHMNIITNFRSHPLAAGIKSIFFVLPAAMLGASPTEVIVCAAFAGFIVLMQHTDMDWNLTFVEKYLLIGAAGHRLHHSMDPKHQGRNLGYVVIWDWLFGTLYKGETVHFVIGIDSDVHHVQNSGKIKTELWGIYAQTLRVFLNEVRATLTMAREKQN